MGAPTPAFIPEAFAIAAAGGNITFPIPDTSVSPVNAASWHLGFPPVTMQPEISGGEPPLGQDFNGILYTMSTHLFALQAGQPYLFDSGVEGAISGYAVGALLGMADGSGLWLNQSAANATNPDSGGAGWVPGISYGIAAVNALTGGSVSLTPAQWRKPIIEFNGALTSNLTIVFPTTTQEWLLVNNTTGSHTLTAKTAGGTGVAIPQGGAAGPTGVWGDGVNINLQVTPLSVAIDTAATPNTLAERDNVGNLFAHYLNSNTALEVPAVGAVFVQNAAADGYARKISLANFLLQLAAGSVVSNSNGTALIFPNGYIIQFGYAQQAGGTPSNVPITFPIPFPTAPPLAGGGWTFRSSFSSAGTGFMCSTPAPSKTGMSVVFDAVDGHVGTLAGGFWIALGH